MLLSEGQMSDFKGAALMIGAFPDAGDKSDLLPYLPSVIS